MCKTPILFVIFLSTCANVYASALWDGEWLCGQASEQNSPFDFEFELDTTIKLKIFGDGEYFDLIQWNHILLEKEPKQAPPNKTYWDGKYVAVWESYGIRGALKIDVHSVAFYPNNASVSLIVPPKKLNEEDERKALDAALADEVWNVVHFKPNDFKLEIGGGKTTLNCLRKVGEAFKYPEK